MHVREQIGRETMHLRRACVRMRIYRSAFRSGGSLSGIIMRGSRAGAKKLTIARRTSLNKGRRLQETIIVTCTSDIPKREYIGFGNQDKHLLPSP